MSEFTFPCLILALGLISGQLLRFNIGGGGLIGLDLTVLILCIYSLIRLKLRLIPLPKFIFSAMFFSFMGLLALIFSPLHLSFIEKLISFFYNARFFIYLLLGWVLYLGAFEIPLEKVLKFSGSILSLGGILQLIFLPNLSFLQSEGWDPHYFRAVSSFLDPNFLGGFLSLTLPLYLMKTKKTKLPNILFLITYLAIVVTFSRSSAIFCIVTLTIFALLKKSVKLLSLTFILGIGFLIAFNLYHRLVSQPMHIDRSASASFRIGTWNEGGLMLVHSPIFGVGFNSYRFGLREYKLAPEQAISSHGGSTNDSSLIYVADTTGVIGLTAYLAFLSSIMGFAVKKYSIKETWAIYTLSGMGGLIINSTFVNSLFYPPMLLWMFATAAKLYKD